MYMYVCVSMKCVSDVLCVVFSYVHTYVCMSVSEVEFVNTISLNMQFWLT